MTPIESWTVLILWLIAAIAIGLFIGRIIELQNKGDDE